MKEFVFITLDEYTSLISSKNQVNHQKTSFWASRDTTRSEDTLSSQTDLPDKSSSEFDDEKFCTQLNLNSRLKEAQLRKEKTSDDAPAERAKTLAKTDQIILDLLSPGLSGGKVERARQILQKVDQCNVISIDRNSGRLMLHGRDLDSTVFDFLNDLQTTTKIVNEGTLDLFRRLKLPNFLLANTHAKRIAKEVADYDDNGKDGIESYSTAKWLRLY